MRLSDDDLDRLERLARGATRGPWAAEDGDDSWDLYGAVTPHFHPSKILKAPKHGTPYAEWWPNANDSAYLAAADPQTVLALISEVRCLRVANADHLRVLNELRGDDDDA